VGISGYGKEEDLKIDSDRGKEKATFGRRKTPEEEEGKGKRH
jgi:hypothetical protein